MLFTADRKADILAALKLADELKVKPIISGGTEAWKVAAELKKRDVPVILGPVMSLPRETGDQYDAPFTAAAKLHEAGVRFCLRSTGGEQLAEPPLRGRDGGRLRAAAGGGAEGGDAVPRRRSWAWRDKFGNVEAGQRANLVIANGDVLQASTQVLGVFIEGRPYEPTNKQTRLYDKYLKRLTEIKAAESPPKSGGRP